jgi:hypothetical protein
MPRCSYNGVHARRDDESVAPPVEPELLAFWNGLDAQERRRLLCISKKTLFESIHRNYCSR